MADTLPNEITLDRFSFSDGKKMTLNGTAAAGSDKAILGFYEQARKVAKDGQPLFDVNAGESVRYNTVPGGALMWNFTLELKRAEAP